MWSPAGGVSRYRPLEDVAKARLMESRAEVELAKKFLHAGLLRNAAGKAFQAWKAHLSYLAMRHQDLFQLDGVKILRRGLGVLRKEWVLALAPAAMLTQLAEKLGEGAGGCGAHALALLIHEYQSTALASPASSLKYLATTRPGAL